MKIIGNFLDQKTYIDLVKVIMEARFPWNFVNGKSEIRDGDFQFPHLFVDDGGKITSPYYKILFPLIKRLDPEKIYFITKLFNDTDLIKIRNRVLTSALPLRV